MIPYEVPVAERFQPAIEATVARLATGDLRGLVADGQLAVHAQEPIGVLLRDSEGTLVPLPAGWWTDEQAVMFPIGDPDDWCALIPLWTESGRGPLWLEVDVSAASSALRVVIERIFVRQTEPGTT